MSQQELVVVDQNEHIPHTYYTKPYTLPFFHRFKKWHLIVFLCLGYHSPPHCSLRTSYFKVSIHLVIFSTYPHSSPKQAVEHTVSPLVSSHTVPKTQTFSTSTHSVRLHVELVHEHRSHGAMENFRTLVSHSMASLLVQTVPVTASTNRP